MIKAVCNTVYESMFVPLKASSSSAVLLKKDTHAFYTPSRDDHITLAITMKLKEESQKKLLIRRLPIWDIFIMVTHFSPILYRHETRVVFCAGLFSKNSTCFDACLRQSSINYKTCAFQFVFSGFFSCIFGHFWG